ncbi:MAG TPA: peptide ABC transporter substrate-binding protein [Gemmatimonadaceae bacterium]|nr:peptide ABC transporter substrate-binding protein [Gemmatimonadaceae bacterium]
MPRLRRASIAVGLALAACGAPPRAPGVAVYASGTDLESANPLVTIHALSRQVQRYVLFTTLARYDDALRPAPYLARRWEWRDDRHALVFHLVPAVRWHDGVATTARDVAFTLLAARDPATGYPRASDLAALDTVIAPDDSTAELRFASPQPAFPLVLCELPILPRHLLGATPRQDMRRAAFNTAPVGNGPFRFVRRTPGQQWVFTRNDEFPAELGGPPSLRGLVITVVDEPTTKFAGLASGDLDVAGIAPQMAALAQRDPAMRVLSYPVLLVNGIVFNSGRPPFDDVRVRRAIALSVDRARLVHVALAGFGEPAGGPVPLENPLSDSAPPRLAVSAADSLLEAAGWRRGPDGMRSRNGRPLAFELLTVGSGDNAIEQLLQSDLRARGIAMSIRQSEMGAFRAAARARPRRFDALLTGIPGDLSLGYLRAMFDSRQAGSALDYAGFHTAALDAAFARAAAAASDSARASAWRDVQRQLRDDAPVAWLYHSRGVQGVSARLRNVTMDLRGELATVTRWTLDAGAGRP